MPGSRHPSARTAIVAVRTAAPARFPSLALLVLAAAALGGCATYRLDVPRRPSYTLPANTDTAIARALKPALDAHPGESAFSLLQYGSLAFLSRAALADLAERSLDVQYYIYETDESGVVLADRLLAAARRGVRVRLLVDDNNLVRSEDRLATLAGQANFEIRVFNPYRNRVRGCARSSSRPVLGACNVACTTRSSRSTASWP